MKRFMKNTSVKNSDITKEWQVAYSKAAQKFLEKLSDNDKRKILDKVAMLIVDDRNLDIKFLKSSGDQYRLRVGNYRVIYEKYNDLLLVQVIKIGDRKDVYGV